MSNAFKSQKTTAKYIITNRDHIIARWAFDLDSILLLISNTLNIVSNNKKGRLKIIHLINSGIPCPYQISFIIH